MKSIFPVIVLALICGPPTRGSAQGPERPSPRDQKCEKVAKRPERREASTLFGAAAKSKAARDSLDADLSQLLAGQDPGRGYLVLHVDEATGSRKLELIDVTIDSTVLRAISTRVANYANRRNETVVVGFPIGHPDWSLDSIPLPYETCAPSILNQPTISRILAESGRKFYQSAPSFVDVRLETRVWIFINEQGKPIATMLKQSSGDRDYDRMVKEVARRMQFYPAFWAGKALPVWVDIPIRLVRPAEIPR